MINSSKLISILLDANVLYPAPIRDLLLNLADFGLFMPKWTNEIHDEWIRNLLKNRPDLNSIQLEKTKKAMNSAFPDALIQNYEMLIPNLDLPDLNDRHVLAAAIKEKVPILVTFNLKDFPKNTIKKYNIEVQNPDEFIINLIRLNEKKAINTFKNQVLNLKNPPKSQLQVLNTLNNCGLKRTSIELKNLLEI